MQGQFDESITANGQGHLTARKNELASQSQQEAKCVMEAKIKERKERQRKNKQVVMAFVKHMQFQTHRKIFNQHFDCILYWKRGRLLWAASKPHGKNFGDLGSGRDAMLSEAEAKGLGPSKVEAKRQAIVDNNRATYTAWRALKEEERDKWCLRAKEADAKSFADATEPQWYEQYLPCFGDVFTMQRNESALAGEVASLSAVRCRQEAQIRELKALVETQAKQIDDLNGGSHGRRK